MTKKKKILKEKYKELDNAATEIDEIQKALILYRDTKKICEKITHADENTDMFVISYMAYNLLIRNINILEYFSNVCTDNCLKHKYDESIKIMKNNLIELEQYI